MRGRTGERLGSGVTLAVVIGLAAWFFAGSAQGGAFADFEADLRGVYAVYRNALFATNQNKVEESARAVSALSAGWKTLETKWTKAAPPQYADDAQFSPTLAAAGEAIAAADRQIAAGDLGAAHLTLERIRDQLGALRARNNVATFSDRMNEFHEEMEKALAALKSDLKPAALADIREQAAVLAYLGERIAAAPPAEARSSTDFDRLASATMASVKSLREAAAANDVEGVKRALLGLKKSYAVLFLKFG